MKNVHRRNCFTVWTLLLDSLKRLSYFSFVLYTYAVMLSIRSHESAKNKDLGQCSGSACHHSLWGSGPINLNAPQPSEVVLSNLIGSSRVLLIFLGRLPLCTFGFEQPVLSSRREMNFLKRNDSLTRNEVEVFLTKDQEEVSQFPEGGQEPMKNF